MKKKSCIQGLLWWNGVMYTKPLVESLANTGFQTKSPMIFYCDRCQEVQKLLGGQIHSMKNLSDLET